jgi:predicted ATPase
LPNLKTRQNENKIFNFTAMIKSLKIANFKSILSEQIELSNVNVFIGENGCGKTNILEAVAMLGAANESRFVIQNLANRGARITKPALTMSSFKGQKAKSEVTLTAQMANTLEIKRILYPHDPQDIYSDWRHQKGDLMPDLLSDDPLFQQYLTNYLIFNLNTAALRGLTQSSLTIPLGINGEGLDILLHDFAPTEWQILKKYSHLISWLDEIIIDETDSLKFKGHKLGRSHSFLYFRDKYMRKDNNVFAAENSNEGVLHILFYLALFISHKTPLFFAIDNIESSLNPQLCRILMRALSAIAVEQQKQVLITTHNPAILDGLNLFDPHQRLYVVKRTDKGDTKTEQIVFKPTAQNKDFKLSELWMRGYLGGLPNHF